MAPDRSLRRTWKSTATNPAVSDNGAVPSEPYLPRENRLFTYSILRPNGRQKPEPHEARARLCRAVLIGPRQGQMENP